MDQNTMRIFWETGMGFSGGSRLSVKYRSICGTTRGRVSFSTPPMVAARIRYQ